MNKLSVTLITTMTAIALLILPTAQAADIELSETCSLADAITAANKDEAVGGCPAGDGADTISLSGDIKLEAVLPQITTEITIEGNDHTISGNGRYRIFVVNGGNLTVNDLTMTKGFADWGGAIVNVNGGTLTINDSTISHSQASEGGGIGNESMLKINDSKILSNSSEIGGAIHSLSGSISIISSSLDGNHAVASNTYSEASEGIGGGIYIENGQLILDNSSISSNTADKQGGAVWLGEAVIAEIMNSTIIGNESYWQAGGFWISNDSALIVSAGSIISENASESNGGGIYLQGGKIEISQSILSFNSSGHVGGGIFCERGGAVKVNKSTMNANSAENRGGGLRGHSCIVSISNTAINNNSVNRGGRFSEGGGISTSGPTEIRNSTLSNNSAELGGAIYSNLGRGKLLIVNSSFSENTGFEDGGAVYVEAGETLLTHLTLVNNTAERGGGIYRSSDALVGLINTIIASNSGGDCFGRLSENINNLIADGSCFATLTGDPMLGELVEPVDGSPAYFPLLAGSPAIDAADSEYCPDADITGTARPQGAGCDIGAYELPQE